MFQKLQNDLTTARKQKDAVRISILSTLIGEIQQHMDVDKNISDEKVLQLIKKFVKNNNDFIALTKDIVRTNELQFENDILNAYLPKQLTESELRTIIVAQLQAGSNLGQVMAFLKANYLGLYDGALASRIAKE